MTVDVKHFCILFQMAKFSLLFGDKLIFFFIILVRMWQGENCLPLENKPKNYISGCNLLRCTVN